MSTSPAPAVHDYGQRQRGIDYSIYSFNRTPTGMRFYVAGYTRPGDAVMQQGDNVTITPPGHTKGRTCRVVEVVYSGSQWDAVLDMADPPAYPHEPGARPAPLSRLLFP